MNGKHPKLHSNLLLLKLNSFLTLSRTNTTPTLKCTQIIGLLPNNSAVSCLLPFSVTPWRFFRKYMRRYGCYAAQLERTTLVFWICSSRLTKFFFLAQFSPYPTQIIHRNVGIFVRIQKMWLLLLWELQISAKWPQSNTVFRLCIHSLKVSDGTRFLMVINDVMYRRSPTYLQTALLTIQSCLWYLLPLTVFVSGYQSVCGKHQTH